MKESIKDFQDLEGFPEYAATDDGGTTNGTRNINQIITNEICEKIKKATRWKRLIQHRFS